MPRLAYRFVLLFVSAAAATWIVSCGANTQAGGPGSGGGGTPPAITGHLAVADGGDNRILIYDTPLSAKENASIVIGQANFTQGSANQGNANPSAATLDVPEDLAVDPAGNLWVADNKNCRVLEFQPPFTTGMSASLVIGEPDFKTAGIRSASYCDLEPSSPLSSTYMGSPDSIAFDNQGDLWVVEASVGRVAEYLPPFSNGMAPSAVIGQTNLQNSAPCNGAEMGNHGPILPPTAAMLCTPSAIAFDPQGDLWVADAGNVRILKFAPPFSTGMSASLEMIGQPPIAFEDNGTSCNSTSASNFCGPVVITFDKSGDLWLADSSFYRVLEFVPPFSNGMAATLEIGQPNLNDAGPFYSKYLTPGFTTFDSSGDLIVTSGTPFNSQILVYAPPFNSGMSAKTMTPQPEDPCPASGSAANTLCGPNGVVVLQ